MDPLTILLYVAFTVVGWLARHRGIFHKDPEPVRFHPADGTPTVNLPLQVTAASGPVPGLPRHQIEATYIVTLTPKE